MAQESSEWDSWIKAAFDAFDVDGSGRLDTGKLNQVLCGDVCEVCCQGHSPPALALVKLHQSITVSAFCSHKDRHCTQMLAL